MIGNVQKRRTDLPQNYRPIARLNVICNFLASISQARISSKMDGTLDGNQVGFKGESTAQRLFILRRTQGIQEEAALECHLLLIDWEKPSTRYFKTG